MDLREMQRIGSEVAAQADALACGSVDLQFERTPGLRERFGEKGVAKSYDDARHTMGFLAEAVSLGSPATFVEYVRWLNNVLLAAHVPPGILAEHLGCIREVVSTTLSVEAAAQVTQMLEQAIAALDGTGSRP